MSGTTLPYAPKYNHSQPTTESLDYAELTVIDLAKAATPEGRASLALEARDAMANVGFFYVINHGYTLEQTNRATDIANVPFVQVDAEEKLQYSGTMKVTGSYQGYKLRQYWHIDGGVHDQIEHYNINRDVTKRQHPQPVRPFLPEIEAFARHNHLNVLFRILKLLALGLELPEDTFVDMHGFDDVGESYVRFMKYYPRSDDEEVQTKNVWLKGHTDFGSITILWSQPVAGLQILTREGTWKWIRHIENALVINAGDALEFLSGGYYRATIHRVIQPPLDQRHLERLGAFYFALPSDSVVLSPLSESPVLERVGIIRRVPDSEAPTVEQWRRARTSAYGQSELKKGIQEGVEEEVIGGVVVKHYN